MVAFAFLLVVCFMPWFYQIYYRHDPANKFGEMFEWKNKLLGCLFYLISASFHFYKYPEVNHARKFDKIGNSS